MQPWFILCLILWIIFAIACAAFASSKNRSSIGWFCLGFLFGIFALIAILCLPEEKQDVQEMKEVNNKPEFYSYLPGQEVGMKDHYGSIEKGTKGVVIQEKYLFTHVEFKGIGIVSVPTRLLYHIQKEN